MSPGNIQQSTSNAQHPMITLCSALGCSMLDVGWWMFKARRSVEEFSSWDRAFAVPIMETALLSQG
jgi:hypothetical protein